MLEQKHIDRFWVRVDKSMNCWEWNSYKDQDGYGLMYISPRMRRAHRLSYELATGQEPGNLSVLHKCDNPSCVRPDHLFLGTNNDNMADMREKERSLRGQRNGRHRFTPEQVREIRARFANYKRGMWAEVAREYGVSTTAIQLIVNRKNWAHVE